jgi:hypothetical protein
MANWSVGSGRKDSFWLRLAMALEWVVDPAQQQQATKARFSVSIRSCVKPFEVQGGAAQAAISAAWRKVCGDGK